MNNAQEKAAVQQSVSVLKSIGSSSVCVTVTVLLIKTQTECFGALSPPTGMECVLELNLYLDSSSS